MASKVIIIYKGKTYRTVGNPIAHISITNDTLTAVGFSSTTIKVKEIKEVRDGK